MNKTAIMALLICTAVFAQQKGSFTDPRDGRKYKYTTIGKQIWMAENLNYAGKNDEIGVCYDKKPENCEKYGALYTWKEAEKICPSGWHLPSKDEWEALLEFAGGTGIAGKKLIAKGIWKEAEKKKECKYTTKDTTGRGKVIVTEHDECVTDEFGFSALPVGGYIAGAFKNAGAGCCWWSTFTKEENYRWCVDSEGKMDGNFAMWSYLFSVRCLKN